MSPQGASLQVLLRKFPLSVGLVQLRTRPIDRGGQNHQIRSHKDEYAGGDHVPIGSSDGFPAATLTFFARQNDHPNRPGTDRHCLRVIPLNPGTVSSAG
jgi:hypothetical protein